MSEEDISSDSDDLTLSLYEDPTLTTGVIRAMVNNDLEEVRKLLSEGETLNTKDPDGNTLLHIAVIRDLPDIVNYLLSFEDVDVNCENNKKKTALYYAIRSFNIPLTETLLKANASLEFAEGLDKGPLHIAVPDASMLHLLLENGASVNELTNDSNETALHLTMPDSGKIFLESVHVLLYYNADTEVTDAYGYTPFMCALYDFNYKIIDILFDYVSDFNRSLADGRTMLYLAFLLFDLSYARKMIRRGAEVNNYVKQCFSPLYMCFHYFDLKTFKLIWSKLRDDGSNDSCFSEEAEFYHELSTLTQNQLYGVLRFISDGNNVLLFFKNLSSKKDLNGPVIHCFTSLLKLIAPPYTSKTAFNRSIWVEEDWNWFNVTFELIFLYLSNGYVLNSEQIEVLYDLFGYSQFLFSCLLTDIEILHLNSLRFVRILYDMEISVEILKDYLIEYVSSINFLIGSDWLEECLPHFRFRKSVMSVGEMCDSTIFDVPSLLELSRNATRDFLIEKFNLRTSKAYIWTVQTLPIANRHKNLLCFKENVYSKELRDGYDSRGTYFT